MRKIIAAICSLICIHAGAATPLYKDASLPVEKRVADLLRRMTTQEKIGQLLCPMGWEMYERSGSEVKASEAFMEQNSREMAPGIYWATLRADPWTRKTIDNGLDPRMSAEALNALQRHAVEHTRLGIPLLFAEECPHGHMAIGSTMFPTGLSMASTWNPGLLEQIGLAVGMQTRSKGAQIGYGPVIDVARDPRWSRMEETFGEDPVLSGLLGSAYMRGMQKGGLVSTLKHFAAYGVPEAGLNGAAANVGNIKLYSDYLEPFRRAVSEGAGSIMTSYNTIDGIPATAHRKLLSDELRGAWGFDGVVFSDLFSIDGIKGAGVASDAAEAAALALKAGVDIDLGAQAYRKGLPEALRRGLISMADIDRAAGRVLAMKFRLGLFENPYVDPEKAASLARSSSATSLARQAASEGSVLLKNNGVLPLRHDIKRIAVIGPNADNVYNQLGDYTAPQAEGTVSTLLDGIRSRATEATVEYVKGCAVRDTALDEIDRAVEAARRAQVAIVAVGGSSARDFRTKYEDTGAASVSGLISDMDCGEGFDRSTLNLLGRQEELLRRVIATGTPTLVVYITGRPLDMTTAADKADALLLAWYPGAEGGRGLADIIFGDMEPSGRTPVSIPRSAGQLPVYYSQGKRRDYTDGQSTPLYPFGAGLGYTEFSYSEGKLLAAKLPGEIARVSCIVTNTGKRRGTETVQLYVTDKVASVAQPALALRDFRRVELAPGESCKVVFPVTPDHLAIYGSDLRRRVEPGEFVIRLGHDSATLPVALTLTVED